MPKVSTLLSKDREYTEAPPTQISITNIDDSSDSDEESLTNIQVTAIEIQCRLNHISDVINKLFSLARVIRASGVRSRTTKAAKYVHYEDGINQTRIFEEDYLPDVLRRRYQVTEPLLSRLCKVISLRRRRFMYQLTHQKRIAYGAKVVDTSSGTNSLTDGLVTTVQLPQAGTPAQPLAPAVQRRQAKSGITRPTHATTFGNFPLRQSAASTMVASTAKLAMENIDIPPPPPLVDNATHFQCPYCCLLVEEHKATENAWREHLVNDLQPFACIEPECPDPYVVLETWTDWVEHHKWTHAMEWWCEGSESDHSPTRFATAEEYSEHLLHNHMPNLSARSLSNRANAAGGPSQEPFKCCPFCDFCAPNSESALGINGTEALTTARLSQRRLQGHIFSHLLAMFMLALPGRDDIEERGSEDLDLGLVRRSGVTGDGSSLKSTLNKPLSSVSVPSPLLPWTEHEGLENISKEDDTVLDPDLGVLSPLTTSLGDLPMLNVGSPLNEASRKPPAVRESMNEDDEKEEGGKTVKGKGIKMDLKIPVDPIIPNFDGFKSHVSRLTPRLVPFLIERIAFEQLRRYKNLLENKIKHTHAVNVAKKCTSGGFCFGLNGKAIMLPLRRDPQDTETIDAQFHINIPGEEDVNTFDEGAVTAALFPLGIPLPPVESLPAEFECTLCFKVKKFQRPSDWIKHVHEDIQPFTCTFPHCNEPKSFKRKADWVRHENERHRQLELYQCNIPECKHTCYRKDNFVQHLIREHKMPEPKTKSRGSWSSRPRPTQGKADIVAERKREQEVEEVWRLVENCRHDTGKMPRDEPCRFCGDTCDTWKKLATHVAKHMEEIAVPVIDLVKQREVSPGTTVSPIDRTSGKGPVRDDHKIIPGSADYYESTFRYYESTSKSTPRT